MTDRPTNVRDRRTWIDGAPDERAAVATAQAGVTPISGRAHRRRVWSLVLVFSAALFTGGAMSVIPRPEREVTKMVRSSGAPRNQRQAMTVSEKAYGFPFRTWIVQRGPVEAATPTYGYVDASPKGAMLNVLLATVAGLLVLFSTTPGKRRDQAE